MRQFWLYLHLAGVLTFVFGHGVSGMVSFKIRGERDPARIQALLDLSGSSLALVYIGLLLLLAAGIVSGFLGRFWGTAWIWTAIGLLVALIVSMYALASTYYNRVREVAGAQTYQQAKKKIEPGPPGTPEQIEAVLRSPRPWLIAVIGGVGLLAILWLMIFKPF
jgi:hypothetical protein